MRQSCVEVDRVTQPGGECEGVWQGCKKCCTGCNQLQTTAECKSASNWKVQQHRRVPAALLPPVSLLLSSKMPNYQLLLLLVSQVTSYYVANLYSHSLMFKIIYVSDIELISSLVEIFPYWNVFLLLKIVVLVVPLDARLRHIGALECALKCQHYIILLPISTSLLLFSIQQMIRIQGCSFFSNANTNNNFQELNLALSNFITTKCIGSRNNSSQVVQCVPI